MASNADLIKSIQEIDKTATVEGLNNVQLTKLLKGLKEKQTASDDGPAITDCIMQILAIKPNEIVEGLGLADLEAVLTELRAKPPKVDKPKATGYVVAPGKSIVCKRGVVDAGEAIAESDIGIKEAFKKHVDNKVIVRA